MFTSKKRLAQWVCVSALSLLSSAAFAVTIEQIRMLDANDNNKIDAGPERQAVLKLLDKLTSTQLALITSVDPFEGVKSGIPVGLFDPALAADRMNKRCSRAQTFFLRDKMVSVSVLNPDFVGKAGNAASLSVTDDAITNEMSWDTKGAAAWVLGDRCLDAPKDWQSGETVVSGIAVAPFIEFEGKGKSDTPGTSSLRFGLFNEIQIFSGPFFNVQHVSVEPYYQTDFDLEGDIFGLRGEWSPVKLDYRLNGYIGANKPFQYWWTFNGVADFLRVDQAGRTGLSASTDYGWVGARIGANIKYKPDSINGIYANAGFETLQDTFSSSHADNFSGEIGLYLDKNQKSALSLNYEAGKAYKTLSKTDKVVLAFKLTL